MSGGTGSGFLDDILNIKTQIGTFGLVGYGDEGFRAGVTTEGVKEVTGVNAAEEANALAREQFEQESAQLQQDRDNALEQNRRRQTQASNAAGAVRNASNRNTSATTSRPNTNLGNAETDFLGL